MIPKILHQTGHVTPASQSKPGKPHYQLAQWEERRIAAKARRLMSSWDYHLWTNEDNESIVASIIPRRLEQFRQLSTPIIGVDIARCLFLYKYGGIYFDTDYRFFQEPPDSFLKNKCVLGIEEYNVGDVGGVPKLGNAFMASEPGFGMWLDFVNKVFDNLIDRPDDLVVQLSGPHALTRFLHADKIYKDQVTILPPEVIYPAFARMKTTGARRVDTIGVHLCWGSWRNKPPIQKYKNRFRRLLSAI